MKKNISINYIFVCLLCCVFLSSCKTKKKATTTTIDALDRSAVYEKVNQSNLNYEYLEASGTAIIRSDQINVSGSFLLRLHKDKAAWMRIQKLGFEAVRVMLKNDTVTLLNRLEKSYQKMSIDEASKMTHLHLNQEDLIDLMAGNTILEGSEFVSLKTDSVAYDIKVAFDDFFASYSYDFILDEITSSEFLDLDQRKVSTSYSNFGILDDGQSFAFSRLYNISGTSIGDASLELKIKGIKINEPLTFPFEVPSHYNRIY